MQNQAFLKCYRRLAWRRDSQFSTWLFALALNVYRSHLRRYQPEVSGGEALRALTVQPAQDLLPGQQEREMVRRAVTHLPPKYRDPLILYYFREEDVAETARSKPACTAAVSC